MRLQQALSSAPAKTFGVNFPVAATYRAYAASSTVGKAGGLTDGLREAGSRKDAGARRDASLRWGSKLLDGRRTSASVFGGR